VDIAETLIIDGESYKKRSPTGIWVLTVVTLTVYWSVWYYKINDEARRYLRDESVKPWLSVLAIVPGFLLLFIPVVVSGYRTGQRIQRMERQAGIAKTVKPSWGFVFFVLTIITLLLLLGGGAFYYQTHLNALWDAANTTSNSDGAATAPASSTTLADRPPTNEQHG
jgi:hypothetical protein